jgi:hypothetical protein
MQTSARNGIGTQMLFHRPAGPGLYEATVWFTFIWFPLFPKSTWLVRPQNLKVESIAGGTSTTHSVEFLERRKMPLSRILTMYFLVACAIVIAWGPVVGFFWLTGNNPELEKTWVKNLWLPAAIWVGAFWWFLGYRRDKLYETASKQQGAGASA